MASLLETVSPGARRFLARQRKEPAMTVPNQQLVEAVKAAMRSHTVQGVVYADDAGTGYRVMCGETVIGSDFDTMEAAIDRCDDINALAAIQATDGEYQRLRSALDPFARVAAIADEADPDAPDDEPCRNFFPGIWPTRGDCRRALAALKEQSA
jgi:hypothetical protein